MSLSMISFLNSTVTTEIYTDRPTLPLHSVLPLSASRVRRMSLDSVFSVRAVPEGRFDRTRKVDRRQQVNSPSNSDGMILRTDGRLSKGKQRTANLASTVHEMEIVILKIGRASGRESVCQYV